MRLVHPSALGEDGVADDYVDVNGDLVPIDDDGTFDAPAGWAEAFAARYDRDLEELHVAETCETIKSDGEVCGRDLPCPYHSDDSA